MRGRKIIKSCGKLLEAVYANASANGKAKNEHSMEQLRRSIDQLKKIEKYF